MLPLFGFSACAGHFEQNPSAGKFGGLLAEGSWSPCGHARKMRTWPTRAPCCALCRERVRASGGRPTTHGCRARWARMASCSPRGEMCASSETLMSSQNLRDSRRFATVEARKSPPNEEESHLNLWLMSRYGQLRWWNAGAEYKDSPLRSGRRRLGSPLNREEHRCPRDTGGTHPARISCVRNAVTPRRGPGGDVR